VRHLLIHDVRRSYEVLVKEIDGPDTVIEWPSPLLSAPRLKIELSKPTQAAGSHAMLDSPSELNRWFTSLPSKSSEVSAGKDEALKKRREQMVNELGWAEDALLRRIEFLRNNRAPSK